MPTLLLRFPPVCLVPVARLAALAVVLLALSLPTPALRADETCNSPYLNKLIQGQEDYLHVWTLGVEGLGDGSDKLVTVDVNPASAHYGKVVDSVSVGGRGEAHHMGFSDDRQYLWAGRLHDSRIFIFDIGSNPAHPRLLKVVDDLTRRTGYAGPHTFYALPGRMLIGALSNSKDGGGATGLAVYNNRGDFVAAYPMPVATIGGVRGDGYGYDIGINPRKNVMLTSSFTGLNNYMTELATLVNDKAAMQRFGNTLVLWDAKTMTAKKIFKTPGAPLELRWSPNGADDWAITATALTSQLWLIKQDAQGEWQSTAVAKIGDPAKLPLPVDISIAADGKSLWVNTFMDGKTRLFDLSNPQAPRQVYEKVTGKQVNMISQSWDGKRIYVSSSLLAHWDKKGADNEQFLKLFWWDGKQLHEQWKIDFYKEKLGRAHHMKMSAAAPGSAPSSTVLLGAR
jgi:selenium-binding protein 1